MEVTLHAILAMLRRGLARSAGLFGAAKREREIAEELEAHLRIEADELVRRGASRADARREALVRSGGLEVAKESYRDQATLPALWHLGQDIRYAARGLRRSPGFTIAACLTMALGVGAATSVFGFVNSVFFRPLVPASGNRTVRVFVEQPDGGDGAFAHAAVRLLAERSRSFDLVAEHYSHAPLYVTGNGWQAEIQGAVVSADYFRLVGITPRLGRFFSRDDDLVPDRDAVAVISQGLWASRFGSDPEILTRTIGINGRLFQIIGVAPASFVGVEPDQLINQLWVPTAMFRSGYRWCDPLRAQPPCAVSHVLARLAPHATLSNARAELSALAKELLAFSEPRDSARRVLAVPALGIAPNSQAQYSRLVALLSGVAAILLLVACTNLAGLLLVRGMARRREIAVRVAIGAGRARIVRQLLTENLMLGSLGGLLGVGVSLLGTSALTSFFTVDSEGYRHFLSAEPDLRLLGFALGVTLLSTMLFGTLPAFASARVDPLEGLKVGTGAGAGTRTRQLLVAAQVTLSVMLLVGAGLLTRSFASIFSRQRFDPTSVAIMRARPRLVGYAPDMAQRYLREVVQTLERVPQVQSVTLARGVGLLWEPALKVSAALPGASPATAGSAAGNARQAYFTTIAPDFFATLRVRVLRGREFTAHDTTGTQRVAIVNEALARILWPGASAIDQTVVLDNKSFQVVGVVANFRVHTASESDPPMAFTPFWQNDFEPEVDARLAIRIRGDPEAMAASLARLAASVDPSVPVTEVLSMNEQIAATFSEVHLASTVLIVAGSLALFLSGVGLYGVVAFVVARRTREVGIRMAIGARPTSILLLFLRQTLYSALVGLACGAAAAAAVARLLTSWLIGVPPLDVVAFGGAILAVLIVALVATGLPSYRASRLSAIAALRME